MLSETELQAQAKNLARFKAKLLNQMNLLNVNWHIAIDTLRNENESLLYMLWENGIGVDDRLIIEQLYKMYK